MSPALGVDMLAHPAIHKDCLGMLPPWTAQVNRRCSRLSTQITLIEYITKGLPFRSGGSRDIACMASAIPQAVQRTMLEVGRCSTKDIIYRSLNVTVLVQLAVLRMMLPQRNAAEQQTLSGGWRQRTGEQRVLMAFERTISEYRLITMGVHRHSLPYLAALSRCIGDGQILQHQLPAAQEQGGSGKVPISSPAHPAPGHSGSS